MATQPEQQARGNIDVLLEAAGWHVCDAAANIHAARVVAIREFALKSSHGFADYLLYVDGKATRVIEAKKVSITISEEIVSQRNLRMNSLKFFTLKTKRIMESNA